MFWCFRFGGRVDFSPPLRPPTTPPTTPPSPPPIQCPCCFWDIYTDGPACPRYFSVFLLAFSATRSPLKSRCLHRHGRCRREEPEARWLCGMDLNGKGECRSIGRPGNGGGWVSCEPWDGLVEWAYGRDLQQQPIVRCDRTTCLPPSALSCWLQDSNFTEVFKTPGKMRGKTPRTVRKRNVDESRVVGFLLSGDY